MGFLVSVRQAYRPASAIPDGGETGGPARAAPTGARPHPTATAPEDEGTIVCVPCKRFPISGCDAGWTGKTVRLHIAP